MVYIDYAKAFDSVPHKWILEIMQVYKISTIILTFLAFTMQLWRTDMSLYHEKGVIKIEKVAINRGIYQGDSLSPLIFIIAINPLSLLLNRHCCGYELNGLNITHMLYMDDLKGYSDSHANLVKMVNIIEQFSTDIGMSLGLNKCKVVNMRKGKLVELGGIQLVSGGVIAELKSDEVYKYLGVEELDGVKHERMKTKVWSAAKQKLKKLLESELNSRNLFQAINECVMPVITYSFGAVHWLESEVKGLDVRIRKMLNMYRVFEIKSDVDRLYLPRSDGGRGLQSVWDSFKKIICRISHVLLNSSSEVLKACAEVDSKGQFSIKSKADKFLASHEVELPSKFEDKPLLVQGCMVAGAMNKSIQESRLRSWKNKPQHGAYIKLLESSGLDCKKSLGWMKHIHLDARSEGYLCAAQELALFTRYHEKYIIKSRLDDYCRICKKESETIFHILAGCGILAKREYFTRHNAVCQYVHYEVMKHYKFPCNENWFAHKPSDVVMSKDTEIAYDQIITTDRPIGANRPDLLIRDKKNKKTFIVDILCPCDVNVAKKESEKIFKYGALRKELMRMWGAECLIVPVVVGGLGAVSKDTEGHLERVPGNIDMKMCQKITLMGSKRILEDVLARR